MAYYKRGVSKDRLEKYEDATKDYDKTIEINPNNDIVYTNRGLSKYYLEKYEDAISDFTEAINRYPENDTRKIDINKANAYAHRGICKLEIKKHEEAISDFKKADKYDNNQIKTLECFRSAGKSVNKNNIYSSRIS